MRYRETRKDKELRNWFVNDMTRALLRSIRLTNGELRGLTSLDITFTYPITAIAGRNGAGKSTILALACCAYHNIKSGFKLPKRKVAYYTFSDFFIQQAAEIAPQGIDILYGIAFNAWKKTKKDPTGVGIRYQRRKKAKGGKWNDYSLRVDKNVVFLGIERIVPHSEKSQSKSYARAFEDAPLKGWEDKVKSAVGWILRKDYNSFKYLEHSKYRLPLVDVDGTIYSGFNMGAGENALFEIFSTIYSCGDGALLIMDEIELGLHADAQSRFVDKLKEVCNEMHTQVICTTHSKEIFDRLPYDARYFIENVGGGTKITNSISSIFAFSKMSTNPIVEMDIYVEDNIAHSLLTGALPAAIRSRISIKVIGSASALARQLAALYVRGEDRPTLAIFDGDQRSKAKANLNHAKKMTENDDGKFETWFDEHTAYLPGNAWPEAWVINKCLDSIDSLSQMIRADAPSLSDYLKLGLQAGKHNEFYEISKRVGLKPELCVHILSMNVCSIFAGKFADIAQKIESLLNG